MNRIANITAGVLVLIAGALPAAAAGKDDTCNVCSSATVASLMMGIRSDNEGLRESAAFMLGELRCTEAVIPLMRMLHEEPGESARIAAALALSLIGDPRGVYAVRRAVTFDASSRVRILSAYFYNEYVHPQSFKFTPGGPSSGVNYAGR
jgi:hypothetical protein